MISTIILIVIVSFFIISVYILSKLMGKLNGSVILNDKKIKLLTKSLNIFKVFRDYVHPRLCNEKYLYDNEITWITMISNSYDSVTDQINKIITVHNKKFCGELTWYEKIYSCLDKSYKELWEPEELFDGEYEDKKLKDLIYKDEYGMIKVR